MKSLSLRYRNLLLAFAFLMAITSLFSYYERTRGHLALRNYAERLKQMQELNATESSSSQKRTQTALREFLLDFPEAKEPQLCLSIAQRAVQQLDVDWLFVSDMLQEAALKVLADIKGVPTQQGFEKAGFHFEQRTQGGRQFLVTDIDGDGNPDVLLVLPGQNPGVCFLFRHTKQGWVAHRLSVGMPVTGLQVFEITPHGPKAIVMTSRSYSPKPYNRNIQPVWIVERTMLFDVFVWQQERLNNVLSTVTQLDFAWEHKDRDGSGIQSLRLIENTDRTVQWISANRGGAHAPYQETVYRWDGRRYVPGKQRLLVHPESLEQILASGEALFVAGRYAAAVQTLNRVLAQAASDKEKQDRSSERQSAHYVLGLCHALLGEETAAHEEMTRAANAHPNKQKDPVRMLAQRYLNATVQSGKLPEGLASVGQVFRLLEGEAAAANSATTPSDLLASAHLHLDSYQEVALTGAKQPEFLTKFTWWHGAAVGVWRRDPQTQRWIFWPIAYDVSVLEDVQPEDVDAAFQKLPPAIWYGRLHPTATQECTDSLHILGVYNNPPRIEISIEQSQFDPMPHSTIAWNGQEFLPILPESVAPGDLVAEIERIEATLFERRDYRTTLNALEAMVTRIDASSLSANYRGELRSELYYHQAICYRKLGETRPAEIILDALQRDDPWSSCGGLASAWLHGSGLPKEDLRPSENIHFGSLSRLPRY